MKIIRINLVLYLILVVAVFLRFWQSTQRYGISYDSSRDAIVSFEAARQIQLPLTGSFSSVAPVTFGPWYYYYLIFAKYFIPSPWAPWIALGLASLGTVIIMYKIGKELINPNFGLLLAFIATLSPAQIKAGTALQQHALIGFLSSGVIFILIKLANGKMNKSFIIFWGFIIGVAINTHFQSLGLLTIPFLLFIIRKKIFLFF